MCEVCAIFGLGEHWTESATLSNRAFPADEIRAHRTVRRRRIGLMNRLLAPHGVTVGDWDGEAFMVENAAGRMRVVANLSALWPAIEGLAGRHFDPLDDDFRLG